MPIAGMSLLLDLKDCKTPALNSPALLEELLIGALQFAGLDQIDHQSHSLPDQGMAQLYWLRQGHATLYVWKSINYVSIDIYAMGAPESMRPALDLLRGYLSQKMIARSVNAQLIERGH